MRLKPWTRTLRLRAAVVFVIVCIAPMWLILRGIDAMYRECDDAFGDDIRAAWRGK